MESQILKIKNEIETKIKENNKKAHNNIIELLRSDIEIEINKMKKEKVDKHDNNNEIKILEE